MAERMFITVPLRILAIIWASPYTLLGLLIGFVGVCTDGHAHIRGRVIEFYGGGVKWLLHRFTVWLVPNQQVIMQNKTVANTTPATTPRHPPRCVSSRSLAASDSTARLASINATPFRSLYSWIAVTTSGHGGGLVV